MASLLQLDGGSLVSNISTPLENGLICWLDGKTIKSGDTDWVTSNEVNVIYSNFKVRYKSGSVLVPNTCLNISSSDTGASQQTGSGSYVSNNPLHEAGVSSTGNMTMELFFKSSLPSTGIRLIGFTYASGFSRDWRGHISLSSGKVCLYLYDTSNIVKSYMVSSSVVNDGNFHTITYIKNGNTFSFYIDGVYDISITNTSIRLPVATHNFIVGIGRYQGLQGSDTGCHYGNFYSFSLYNRALSVDEVQENSRRYFKRYS